MKNPTTPCCRFAATRLKTKNPGGISGSFARLTGSVAVARPARTASAIPVRVTSEITARQNGIEYKSQPKSFS
jgi:hypothetical protein